MTATVAQLATINSTSNGSGGALTYTSSSGSPATNDQLVVTVSLTASVTLATGTFVVTDSSGDGITYTLVDHAEGGTSSPFIWTGVFVASKAASSASRTWSVAVSGLSGSNPSGCSASVVAVTGLSLFGAAATLRSAHDSGKTAVAPSPTFGAAARTTSVCVAAASDNWNSTTRESPPTGWTYVATPLTYATPGDGFYTCYIASGFTGTAVTFTGTGPGNYPWSAIAVELDTRAAPIVVTGQSATLTAGTVAPTQVVPLGGQSAALATGTLTPAVDKSAALTGQSISVRQGLFDGRAAVIALFSGKAGFMYDFADASTLFQSDSGTTAVTASTDPIGYVTDLSGNANHGTQATSGAKPLWDPSQGAVCDGSRTMSAGTLDFTGTDKLTVIACIQTSLSSDQGIYAHGSFHAGECMLRMNASAGGVVDGILFGSTGSSEVVNGRGAASSSFQVVSAVFDLAGAAALDEVETRVNGELYGASVQAAGPAGGGNFASAVSQIMTWYGGSNLSGAMVRILVIQGVLSTTDLYAAEYWAGAGGGLRLITELPPVGAVPNNMLNSYGQSLAVGAYCTPVISSTTRFSGDVMFTSGVLEDTSAPDFTGMLPLVENTLTINATPCGETPVSGMAEAIHEQGSTSAFYGVSTAFPAATLADLSSGQPQYTLTLNAAIGGWRRSRETFKHFKMRAFAWMQGESDGGNTSYAAQLETLRANLTTDINAVIGQTEPVWCISYQLDRAFVGLQHLKAQETNSYIRIAMPMYQLVHNADTVHLNATSSKIAGAYLGYAYKQIIEDGNAAWKPLQIASASVSSSTITLTYAGNVGSLTQDTTIVASQTNMGFNLVDSAGSALTISSASITGPNTVQLTAAAPVPACAVVYYGFSDPTDHTAGIAKGNIRDSQGDTVVFDGGGINYPLHNWALLQSIETPFPITGQSIGVSAGTLTVAATSVTAALTGQSIGLAAGTESNTHAVMLSGQSASTATGTLASLRTQVLTGNSAAIQIGTLSSATAPAVSGQSATAATGTLALAHTQALLGQSVGLAAGVLVDSSFDTLTGQPATLAGGTALPSTTVALSGQSLAAAAGTVSASSASTATLIGQSAAASTGAVAPVVATAAYGQSAAAAAGVLNPAIADALTGLGTALVQGAASATTVVALAGQSVGLVAGNVSAGGDKFAALIGQALVTAIDQVAARSDTGLQGASSALASDALAPSADTALTGQDLAAAQGDVAQAAVAAVALTGVSIGTATNAFGPVLQVTPTGIAMAWAQGFLAAMRPTYIPGQTVVRDNGWADGAGVAPRAGTSSSSVARGAQGSGIAARDGSTGHTAARDAAGTDDAIRPDETIPPAIRP